MTQELKARRAVVYMEVIACIIAVLRIFSISKRLGEYGVSYYVIPYELCCVLLIAFSYGICEAVSRMVKTRVERGQYRNAYKVLESAVVVSVIMGLLLVLIVKLMSGTIAVKWFQVPGIRFALSAIAPVLLFRFIAGVFKGFMNGYEVNVASHAIRIIEEAIIWISTYLLLKYYMGYGTKVGNLIQDDSYQYIYGAKGAVLAIIIGSAIYMVLMIVVYFVNRRRFQKFLHKDGTTRDENYGQVCHILFVYAVPMIVISFLILIHHFLIQQHYILNNDGAISALNNFGYYYTGFRCIIIIPILFFAFGSKNIQHEMRILLNDQDAKSIREYASDKLRNVLLSSIPLMVFFAVLSESLLQLFLGKVTSIASYMLFPGSLLIVLYSVVFVFTALLYQLKKKGHLVLILLLANIVYFATITACIRVFKLGVEMLVFSEIAFAAVIILAELFILKRKIRYKQELVYSIFIPYIASFIAGIVIYVVNVLLIKVLGAFITLILCCAIGYFIYLFVLGALKGLDEHEISSYPVGQAVVKLLDKFRLI